MGFTIESVVNAGNDVLLVTATNGEGVEVTATGWVSATENFYVPADYDEAGNLVAGAQPRAMTADEVGAYALQLLSEQNPEMLPQPKPASITFTQA